MNASRVSNMLPIILCIFPVCDSKFKTQRVTKHSASLDYQKKTKKKKQLALFLLHIPVSFEWVTITVGEKDTNDKNETWEFEEAKLD